MLYIVEISTNTNSLAAYMNSMRIWLDHMGYQPLSFRPVSDASVCRVDFENEDQAKGFAVAFGGRCCQQRLANDLSSKHRG
jgi:hypothetical protein